MSALSFNYNERTSMNPEQVLERAISHKERMDERFGANACSLQDAVDSVIDAQIENCQ